MKQLHFEVHDHEYEAFCKFTNKHGSKSLIMRKLLKTFLKHIGTPDPYNTACEEVLKETTNNGT